MMQGNEMERKISNEAGPIANFSLMQVLLQRLIDKKVFSEAEVQGIIGECISLNQRICDSEDRPLISDAIYLLEKLQESLELKD